MRLKRTDALVRQPSGRLPRRSRRGAMALLAVIALVGLYVIPGRCTPQPQDTGFNLEGKITAASAGKLTVSTEENIIFHVSYDGNTSIRRKDGSAGSPADLKIGESIKVAGDLSPAGVIKARLIQIE